MITLSKNLHRSVLGQAGKYSYKNPHKPTLNCCQFLQLCVLTIITNFIFDPIAYATTEVEPNNQCATATQAPSVNSVTSLEGRVDVETDADFFRITGTPGNAIRFQGSTELPWIIRILDSSCNFLVTPYDFASPVSQKIPPDGVLIVGIGNGGNFELDGNASGTALFAGAYHVAAIEYPIVESISGRLIDSVSGVPLPGNVFPNAFVELIQCEDPNFCFFAASGPPELDGTFKFTTDPQGNFLQAGTNFQLNITANGYNQLITPFFDIAPAENKSLGDIPVDKIPVIGSITGRIVDASTGTPPPSAFVNLSLCDSSNLCSFISSTFVGGDGLFEFQSGINIIPAGRYQVSVRATEYEPFSTPIFDVASEENKALGNLALKPFPVRLIDVIGCNDLGTGGGVCNYSVRIVNRLKSRVSGSAWSILDSFSSGSLIGQTTFQTAGRQPISLSRFGSSTIARFSVSLPSTLPNGIFICPKVYVAQDLVDPITRKADSPFNTVASQTLFCLQKGGQTGSLKMLSDREMRKVMKDRREK